jgi:hypothetical protein
MRRHDRSTIARVARVRAHASQSVVLGVRRRRRRAIDTHTIDDIMQYARSLRIKLTRRDARMRHAFARTSIVLQFTRRHVDDDAARIARAQRASRRVANTRLWEVIVDIDGDVDVDVDA